jgi:uncharacterized protein YdaT
MPWTPESFAKKHNHSLSPAQGSQASKVANAILRETGDDAKAIRIANWQAKRMKRKTSIGEMMKGEN